MDTLTRPNQAGAAATGIFEKWDPGKKYAVGDVVSYRGAVFVCHEATVVGAMPSNQAFWTPPMGRGIHDVRHYGAKGDGSTDDTVSIQNAIIAAGIFPCGVVYFPLGYYRITKSLEILGDGSVKQYGYDTTAPMETTQQILDVTFRGVNAEPDSYGGSVLFWDSLDHAAPMIRLSSRGCLFEHLSFSVRTRQRCYAAFVVTRSGAVGSVNVTRNSWRKCFLGATTSQYLGDFEYLVSVANDPANIADGRNYHNGGHDFNHFEDCMFQTSEPRTVVAGFKCWSTYNSFSNMFLRCAFGGLKSAIDMVGGSFHSHQCSYSRIFDPENADQGVCHRIYLMSGPSSISKADMEGCPNFLWTGPTGTATAAFSIRECRLDGIQNDMGSSSYRNFIRFQSFGPFLYEGNDAALDAQTWSPTIGYPLGVVTAGRGSLTAQKYCDAWDETRSYDLHDQVQYTPPDWTSGRVYGKDFVVRYPIHNVLRYFYSLAAGNTQVPTDARFWRPYVTPKAEWNATDPYVRNAEVQHVVGSTLRYYYSLSDGNINNNPVGSSHWEEFYKEGAPLHTNKYYFSLADCNVGEQPTSSPTLWRPMSNSEIVAYTPPPWKSTTTYAQNETVSADPPAWDATVVYAVDDTVRYTANGKFYYKLTGGGAGVPPPEASDDWSEFHARYYSLEANNLGNDPTSLDNPHWKPNLSKRLFRSLARGNYGQPPATQGSVWWQPLAGASSLGASEEWKITGGVPSGYATCTQVMATGNNFPNPTWWETDYSNRGNLTVHSVGNICKDINSAGTSGSVVQVRDEVLQLYHCGAADQLLQVQTLSAVTGISARNTQRGCDSSLLGEVVQVRNLCGELTIGTGSVGTVTFEAPEREATYIPVINILEQTGSSAVTRVLISARTNSGFSFALDEAPDAHGAGTVTLGWHILGAPPRP